MIRLFTERLLGPLLTSSISGNNRAITYTPQVYIILYRGFICGRASSISALLGDTDWWRRKVRRGSLWIGKIPGTTVAPRTKVICGWGRCCRRIAGRKAVEIARLLLGINIRETLCMRLTSFDRWQILWFSTDALLSAANVKLRYENHELRRRLWLLRLILHS